VVVIAARCVEIFFEHKVSAGRYIEIFVEFYDECIEAW